MRVLLSAYGPRGVVDLVVGLAAGLGALGTQVRVCAAAEGCDALVATGVVPAGVWR